MIDNRNLKIKDLKTQNQCPFGFGFARGAYRCLETDSDKKEAEENMIAMFQKTHNSNYRLKV